MTPAVRHRHRGFMCVPRFTAQPSITGTAQNGQTLTGVSGSIANGAVSARQWRRNGVAISGATGATYVLQAADIGTVVTFSVTAANGLVPANTLTAVSAPTATVIA
jgi:hypothetical protein